MHPESEAAFEDALHAAARARPGVHADADFAPFVRARMGPDGKVPLHLADMLVAYAAVRGDARALALLEAELRAIPPMLGRFRLSDVEDRELLQDLRLRLLVGSSAETMGGAAPAPRLLEYRGSGPLGAWIRASAVRLVLSKLRSDARLREDELVADGSVSATGDDAEIALAKHTYRAPFKMAFRSALGELSPRDRTVLRMYLLDGRNIDEIGSVFRVHRATIARWISDARAALGKRTQALLTEHLHTDSAEFRSITRLCYSQIDVSLHTLLAGEGTDA